MLGHDKTLVTAEIPILGLVQLYSPPLRPRVSMRSTRRSVEPRALPKDAVLPPTATSTHMIELRSREVHKRGSERPFCTRPGCRTQEYVAYPVVTIKRTSSSCTKLDMLIMAASLDNHNECVVRSGSSQVRCFWPSTRHTASDSHRSPPERVRVTKHGSADGSLVTEDCSSP